MENKMLPNRGADKNYEKNKLFFDEEELSSGEEMVSPLEDTDTKGKSIIMPSLPSTRTIITVGHPSSEDALETEQAYGEGIEYDEDDFENEEEDCIYDENEYEELLEDEDEEEDSAESEDSAEQEPSNSAISEENYADEEFLANLRPSKSISINRNADGAGILSIINSKRNGKRLALSAELLSNLNNPQTVQISFSDNELVIGKAIPNCGDNSCLIKPYKNKGMVYSSELVDEISENFSLNFFEKTSLTFHKVRYLSKGEQPIAIITIL